MEQQVLEGTWEEIALHAEELKGQRVRLTVLGDQKEAEPNSKAEPLDAMGWPVGFFEETFGSLADDPIERLPQREYDRREPLR